MKMPGCIFIKGRFACKGEKEPFAFVHALYGAGGTKNLFSQTGDVGKVGLEEP